MSFLLDTNILSMHLRRPTAVAHRFFQYSGRLYTSAVALAELFVWAHQRPDPAEITHNTADFRNIPGLRLDDWLAP